MGAIDHLAIVTLGADDAREGLLLSEEAHWNQNEADWRFFLTRGTVFGIRDGDGRLIATAALLPYTSANAWISMVLVTAKPAPPRPCDKTARRLSRGRGETGTHDLAGCDACRRHGLWAARIYADAGTAPIAFCGLGDSGSARTRAGRQSR